MARVEPKGASFGCVFTSRRIWSHASLSALSVSRFRAEGKVPERRDGPDVGTGNRPPTDTNSGGRGGTNGACGEADERWISARGCIRVGGGGMTAQ